MANHLKAQRKFWAQLSGPLLKNSTHLYKKIYMYSDLHKVTKIRHSYKEIFLIIIDDWLVGGYRKIQKISPSMYKPLQI